MSLRIIFLAIFGVTLVACVSVAQPNISSTASSTPTETQAPLSAPTAGVVVDPEFALIEFVESLDPGSLDEVPGWLTFPAGELELNFRLIALSPSTEEEWPILLATHYVPPPEWPSHWIFWWREGRWEHQRLEGFIIDDAFIAARQQISERGHELGIVYDANAHGSAPYSNYSLWRWEAGAWMKIWSPLSAPGEWRGIHGSIAFPGPGLDTMVATSSSWGGEDEKSQIFHESNPGPHRWFQDTWVREGDSYTLTESTTLPSAYNTLVEFIYGLRHGDEAHLQTLVIDPGLVEQAKGLGLENIPNGILLTNLDDPSIERTGPLAFEWQNQMVIFSFTQHGEAWMISEITVS